MKNRELNIKTEAKSSRSRQVVERQKDELESGGVLSPQQDPLGQVTCRIGDASCARAHASTLDRAAVNQPSRAVQSLYQLQRQYGNQYVQRVLAQARKGNGGAEVAPDLEQAIQRARGSGQTLDSSVRAQMESSFGADFSSVRVHADAQADELSRSLNARAFTTGQDVFFRQGAYTPGSSSGQELLAHELAHVVQQTGDVFQYRLTVSQPDDRYEQEASRVARAVIQQQKQTALAKSDQGRVRRQIEEGREEEEDEEFIQTQAKGLRVQRLWSQGEEKVRRQPTEEEREEEIPRPSGPFAIGGRKLGRLKAHTTRVGGSAHLTIQRQVASRGDVGCPVPEVQEKLNVTGARLVVDGRFGSLTQAAVTAFQNANPILNALATPGAIDLLTSAFLNAAAPGNHGLPAGETTHSHGWGTGAWATAHRWQQRLAPRRTMFRGCRVTEADPGGGVDGCHFPGSAIAPQTSITGGTWTVDARNRWGDDWVGWSTGAVNYYRAQGRAPCSARWPQSMRVVRPGGNVEYLRHNLVLTIGRRTVSSTRDGETRTRRWP